MEMNKTLNLSEVATLLQVDGRKVRQWIDYRLLRAKRSPLGYKISPTALYMFINSRRVHSVLTCMTPDMLQNGRLVSIPQAARHFKMKSNKPLYRAIRGTKTLCGFDLAENEARGLRVCLDDVISYLGAQPDLPDPPEPARGNGNGRGKPMVFGSVDGLLKIAERRLADAQQFKRDVETAARAGREYSEAVDRLSRRLPGDWRERLLENGEKIESGDQFKEWLTSA